MSEIRHRDRILEAIDQLRKRKARPDVNRICSFMFRRFAVNCIETKLDLQKLIDAEIVIKVDYKGNTSYRNAAKWAMLPSYKYKKEIDTSSLISSAVAELIVLEPDYLDIGVPQFELEAHMMQKDNKRFSKKNIEAILKREVEIGSLVRLENGNYFIGEHLPKNSNSTMSRPSASNSNVGSTAASASASSNTSVAKTPLNSSSAKQTSPSPKQNKPKPPVRHNDNSNDSDNVKSEDFKMKSDDSLNNSSNESNNVGYRVGGRQKRARVVFDPSDHNLPTRANKKRGPGRPMGSLNKTTILNQNNNNNSNSSSRSTTPTPTTPTLTVNKVSRPTTPTPTPAPTLAPSPVPATTPTPRTTVSTGSQVKTFTKNFDISSSPPPNPNLCSICHSYGVRIKGVPERLVSCSDCTRPTRAHPSCLESSPEGSWSCDRDGTWKCGNCKTCRVCDETSQAGVLVVCVVCRDAYHYQCHSPPVPERSRSRLVVWYCAACRPAPPPDHPFVRERETSTRAVKDSVSAKEKEKVDPPLPAKREERATSSSSTSTSTANTPAECLQDPFHDIPIDESIPDAKHWSANQVYQYFSTHMKPEIAQVFKDQDIDGQALLLMQRMDILTGLTLKLGPALKVYGHVRKLQTRKSHLRVLWS